jgi:hypothetical protein
MHLGFGARATNAEPLPEPPTSFQPKRHDWIHTYRATGGQKGRGRGHQNEYDGGCQEHARIGGRNAIKK